MYIPLAGDVLDSKMRASLREIILGRAVAHSDWQRADLEREQLLCYRLWMMSMRQSRYLSRLS